MDPDAPKSALGAGLSAFPVTPFDPGPVRPPVTDLTEEETEMLARLVETFR